MQTELDILRAARKLITPEEAWYQGALAGDGTSRRRNFSSGDNLDANDPTAKCWCAGGAILKVADLKDFTDPGFVNDLGDADATPSPARKAYERLCDLIPPMDEGGHRVTSYNDSPNTSHEDILDLFDYAINLATEEAETTQRDFDKRDVGIDHADDSVTAKLTERFGL